MKNIILKTLEPQGIVANNKSIAAKVLDYTANLAARTQRLAERVNIRLELVMLGPPCPPETGKESVKQDYPPLFEALRRNLKLIDEALDSIDNAINRTVL